MGFKFCEPINWGTYKRGMLANKILDANLGRASSEVSRKIKNGECISQELLLSAVEEASEYPKHKPFAAQFKQWAHSAVETLDGVLGGKRSHRKKSRRNLGEHTPFPSCIKFDRIGRCLRWSDEWEPSGSKKRR